MRNPMGYATIIDPTASRLTEEFDTITCPHCGTVAMTKAAMTGCVEVLIYRADGTHYMREVSRCLKCYQHVCPKCEGKPCSNRFARLDEEERAAARIII